MVFIFIIAIILYGCVFIAKIFKLSYDTFSTMVNWVFILTFLSWFGYCAIS